jgi:hypothetical protein
MKNMKNLGIIGLAVLCLAALGTIYDETNFSAAGRLFQPVPEGYLIGKDNQSGRGRHHQSEDCGRCHTMGGRAEAHQWTVAGTLYADRSARQVVKGGEIILEDRDGNIISVTSNEAGNFWTTAPIASNPYTVVSHGGVIEPLYVLDENGNLVTPADPANPQTWQYKAWVRHSHAVRPMVTIAPVGSASGMNMSCSMHHGAMGARGGLTASAVSTLPSYPPSGLSYRKHVYPILRSKCAPCHIPGPTMTRLVTKSDIDTPSTSVDHSGGLDLMTYEGSTVGEVIKQGIASVVNTADPEQSLMLQKTGPGGEHGGGTFWNERSRDYQALKQWIQEGALKN